VAGMWFANDALSDFFESALNIVTDKHKIQKSKVRLRSETIS
jgi:hypothetical protein